MTDPHDNLRIGIIGGTGLGDALIQSLDARGMQTHTPSTPFGDPSSPIVTGDYHGVPVAILLRHGPGHVLNPAQVPYRANVFALKSLGCTHLVASGATGSLREDIAPGDLVLCDQLIDRTSGRPSTFYEHAAVHVEFAGFYTLVDKFIRKIPFPFLLGPSPVWIQFFLKTLYRLLLGNTRISNAIIPTV